MDGSELLFSKTVDYKTIFDFYTKRFIKDNNFVNMF